MKKIFYSIGLVSVMLFTACTEDKGTSTEVPGADANENVDPSNINDYDRPGTAATTSSTEYTDATYQENAQEISGQMTNDLQLDDATATEIVKIYYKRNKKLGELEQGASVGETSNQNASTADRTSIDRETDQELKKKLTPEQYRRYEQNRDKYNNIQMNKDANRSGTERPAGSNQ